MNTKLTVMVAIAATLLLTSACNQPKESGDGTAGTGTGTQPSAPSVPTVGKPMSSFEFTNLDGETDSYENYRGKPLLVNFWGTWCSWCKREIPDMVELRRGHRDDGLEIISLAVNDTAEAVKSYVETQEMPWVLGLDSAGLAERWALRGYPTTYFVSRQGMVTHIQVGAMSREMMEEFTAPLLAEDDDATPTES